MKINLRGVTRGPVMSKFTKVLGIVALALIINIGAAVAAGYGGGGYGGGGYGGGYRGGGHGGGYRGGWGGGGWGWGGGWGPDYYYDEPGDCGWVRVRVLRHGHRVVQRVWRCW
jgi:hypothetical protein